MIDDLKRQVSGWVGTITRGDMQIRIEADPRDPLDQQRAGEMLERLLRGEASTATVVPPSPPGTVVSKFASSIEDAIETWIAVRGKKWAEKTRHEFPRIARDFAAWANARGRVDINEITRRDISDYIAHLETREWKKKTATKPAKVGLKKKTINKYLAALNSLFQEAQNSELYLRPILPTKGQFFDDEEVDEESESWKPFTPADLDAVFDPVLFRGRAKKPCEFWVPLLMLHGALRVGEAAQLCTSDVVKNDGVWCLDINKKGPGKKLKNRASGRLIPLHRSVIRMGFLRYVRDIQRIAGDGPIFPWLRADSINGFGDAPGEWFNKYLEELLPDPQKRGHSMRHTANNALNNEKVQEQHRSQFLGHSHKSINTEVYTVGLSPKKLAAWVMPFLRFGLDYRALRYTTGEFDAVIQRELVRRRRRNAHKAGAAHSSNRGSDN